MNQKGWAAFGGAVIIGLLLYQQRKINKLTELTVNGFDVVVAHVESEIQAQIDEEFEDIVENYDD